MDVTGKKKRSRSWSGIVEKEMKVRGEVIAVLNKARRREDVCVAVQVEPCIDVRLTSRSLQRWRDRLQCP